jgi:hypothetical protein
VRAIDRGMEFPDHAVHAARQLLHHGCEAFVGRATLTHEQEQEEQDEHADAGSENRPSKRVAHRSGTDLVILFRPIPLSRPPQVPEQGPGSL